MGASASRLLLLLSCVASAAAPIMPRVCCCSIQPHQTIASALSRLMEARARQTPTHPHPHSLLTTENMLRISRAAAPPAAASSLLPALPLPPGARFLAAFPSRLTRSRSRHSASSPSSSASLSTLSAPSSVSSAPPRSLPAAVPAVSPALRACRHPHTSRLSVGFGVWGLGIR